MAELRVRVHGSCDELGRDAAGEVARLVASAIQARGQARIVAATGNSQLDVVAALAHEAAIDWSRVVVFHLDEYVGLDRQHPASFRRWIRRRIEDVLHPAAVHYLEGDAKDPRAEIARYSALLNEAPIDVAFVGFGENGHIAFNDPHVADFEDPAVVKVVELDEACRQQQVGEGHFPDLASVPRFAFTMTCSAIFRAAAWICCVPELRKAVAVRDALEGPMSEKCPASLVQRHANAFVFLDEASASLLSR